MTDINWNLLQFANPGEAAMRGFEQGRATMRKAKAESALAAFAANPQDGGALNALMVYDPDLAMRLRNNQRQDQEYQRGEQFRSALSDYGAGGGIGYTQPFAERGPTGAPARPGVDLPSTLSQHPSANPAPPPTSLLPDAPTDPRDDAFMRMWEADPVKAMDVDSRIRDQALGRIKVANEAYGFAIQNLANVSDEASYQIVRNSFLKQLEPLGIDIAAQIPDRYPGPQGVRQLLMRAVDAKDQIAALDRRDKLTADIADDQADNERADRNTSSVIDDRGARRGLIARGQNMTDARGRRGQDIASGDRRYGVDKADKRLRETGGKGALTQSSAPGSSRARPITIRSPQDAQKLPKGTWFKASNGNIYQRQ